ncbi:oocyte zinc finger protein XlCOF22-like [Dendropsophus ebraccatus]|uniref:oocyte zinc finger protein XlCOF22-like n=1 Tax=Dendropsophus ebraccatus TaxID=150705 RepID=UPI0038322A58
MEKDRNEISKRILHVTLEIIRLLTGEDYTIVKKTWGEGVAFPQESGGRSRARGPITEPPSLINEQKILELTHRMTELLTGEVPIRCQDVAVYFSMEEWEYVEGHKDLYRGEQPLMMEDQPPGLTAQDGGSDRNPPERCPRPLYSQDCPEGNVPADNQQGGDQVTNIKVEDEAEEERMRGDPRCMSEVKEEEAPGAAIPEYPCSISEGHFLLWPNYKEEDEGAEQHSSGEALLPLTVHPGRHTTDLSYNPPDHEEPSPDRSHTATARTEPKKEKRFQCEECGKLFLKRSGLVTHRKSHTRGNSYSCSECGKCFGNKAHLVTHEIIHAAEKPYSCSECGKRFVNKSHLVAHERIHTAEKPHSCSECGKCFLNKSQRVAHERVHTAEKLYLSSHCRKGSPKRFNLHAEKPFTCSECGKRFIKRSGLVTHAKSHTKVTSLPCSKCGKCFGKQCLLELHERSHRGEKTDSYSACGKSFSNHSRFIGQEQHHTGENASTCLECGKCFVQKSLLDSHDCNPTEEEAFSCSQCGKCFTNQPSLVFHEKCHRRDAMLLLYV